MTETFASREPEEKKVRIIVFDDKEAVHELHKFMINMNRRRKLDSGHGIGYVIEHRQTDR